MYEQSEHSAIVVQLMRAEGYETVTKPSRLKYHQLVTEGGARSMLVVPWPGEDANYVVNDLDFATCRDHPYCHSIMFARVFDDGRSLKVMSVKTFDEVDSLNSRPLGASWKSAGRLIARSLIETSVHG